MCVCNVTVCTHAHGHDASPPGEDEAVREKGIEYVSTSLLSMRHKIFLTNPDNEKFLVEQIKRVSTGLEEASMGTWSL